MKIWIAVIPTTEVSKRELLFRLRHRAGRNRWQFGIEVGTHSGYQHYQCRYETSNGDYEVERRYWCGIKLELQEAGGWSNYELKDGCFYSYLDDQLGKYRFSRLKDLQLCILEHGKRQSDRTISCVVDKLGGIGKTYLARRCWLNGNGIYIDGSGTAKQLVADMYDATENGSMGNRKTVFIDLTRNTNIHKRDIWNAIEQIKNGYLKDSRYALREKWIDPPCIFVFTNNEPKWENMSEDRWDKMFVKQLDDKKLSLWDRDKKGKARTRTFNRNN